MRLCKVFVPVFFLVFGSLISLAHAAPVDLNGDGTSDLTLITIKTNHVLQWKSVYNMADPATLTTITELGRSGDNLAIGRWTTLAHSEPGIIKNDTDNNQILWKLDTAQQVAFGDSEDVLLISGADFNGNGFTDAARVKNINHHLWLEVLIDPFAPGGTNGTAVPERQIGALADKVFFLNPNDQRDWIGIVHRNAAGISQVTLRDPITNHHNAFSVGTLSGTPMPIKNVSGRTTLLAFITKQSNRTIFRFRNLHGQDRGHVTLMGDTPIVGDYLSTIPGEEVAVQSGNTFTIYNPFSHHRETLMTDTGIPVDQINMTTFASVSVGLSAHCTTVRDIDSNYIYKTGTSDHINDARNGGGSFLEKAGGPAFSASCIHVYDSDGNNIANYGFYPFPGANPGAAWKFRTYGRGTYCSTGESATASAHAAQNNTGSRAGYFQITPHVCIKVPDLLQCVNSSNC